MNANEGALQAAVSVVSNVSKLVALATIVAVALVEVLSTRGIGHSIANPIGMALQP